MANSSQDRSLIDHRVGRAIGLLALCAAMNYGYLMFDPTDRAQAWNAAGAIARSALLIALTWKWRGPVIWVVAWWLAEEAMTAGCSALYILRPWVVLPGQDQCSALLGFDIGKIGALAMVALLFFIYRKQD